MPLNPNGMMCPFNGDISGVVAAAGRCSRGAAWLPHHRAQPLPWPSSRPSPTAPGLCSQAGRHLVNLIEGFVLSTPGSSAPWESGLGIGGHSDAGGPA